MMPQMQGGISGKPASSLVCPLLRMAALVPFIPEAWQFFQRGVPDLLFTGDGAALELGTLHAARGVQFLGPYSRFGWRAADGVRTTRGVPEGPGGRARRAWRVGR